MRNPVLPMLFAMLAVPGAAARVTAEDARPIVSPAIAAQGSDIDTLFAPIALYPDQLLAQMLLCAADPGAVAALNEWLASKADLSGTALQDAARASGFEPSFVAIVIFPEVVRYMASELDWTTKIGKAFASDRSAVFASIQRLRAKAKSAGTLKSTPQQDVETKTTSSGEQVIVIEPSNPQVVYVPQYNASTVYTAPTSTTVVIKEDDDDDVNAAVAGAIGFTAGIAIGAAFDNDYYYGPYGWGGGAYMYNDGWDDYWDEREDMREDWQDHREDLVEERGDRAENAREQRTERTQSRSEAASERAGTRSASGETARGSRSGTSPSTASAETASRSRGSRAEASGYSGSGERATRERSGSGSDAFSGYSSGRSTRAASSRGERSRGSARASRGGGRR